MQIDATYHYAGYGHRDENSKCRIQIYTNGERQVLMLSELDDNHGTSITNAIEKILPELVTIYSLDPDKLLIIEHYPPTEGMHFAPFNQHRFSQVIVKRNLLGQYRRPEWVHIYDDAITDLMAELGFTV